MGGPGEALVFPGLVRPNQDQTRVCLEKPDPMQMYLLEPFRAGGVCDTGRRRFHYDPCAWMRGNPGRQGTARYDEGTFGIRDYPHQTNNTGHLELNRRRPRKCTVLPRLHQATPGDRFRQPCLSGPLSTSYLHDLTSSAPFPGCSKSQLLITYISYLFSPHSLTSSL